MNRRICAAWLLLAYFGVALGVGLWHDHQDPHGLNPHDDCRACVWQANFLADEPIPFTVAQPTLGASRPVLFDSALLPKPLHPIATSRAPPVV